jgi:hypothetical protein
MFVFAGLGAELNRSILRSAKYKGKLYKNQPVFLYEKNHPK